MSFHQAKKYEEIMRAPKAFAHNYCARCKGLISRDFLKTQDGYMDIFKWESQADVEHVRATFMQEDDATAYGKLLDINTLTMHNDEVLDSYKPT